LFYYFIYRRIKINERQREMTWEIFKKKI